MKRTVIAIILALVVSSAATAKRKGPRMPRAPHAPVVHKHRRTKRVNWPSAYRSESNGLHAVAYL